MNDRSKDYVFISYSHANNIDSLIDEFDKKGYNVVYDRAMSYGEEWDLNARRYISSEKCKGVIFILSESSLTSKAVLTEIEHTMRFRKKFFSVMLHNLTRLELYNSICNNLDENKKYILDSIMEYLTNEQLYVQMSNLDWDKINSTFEGWDFKSETNGDTENLVLSRYTSERKGEKERLLRQQQGYYNFDMKAINQVLEEFDRDDLCVLDLGCSNGSVAISRFANNPKIKKVIGVDYNSADIEEAKVLAQEYGDKFSFYQVDLEDEKVIPKLNQILKENGVAKVDIVFAALVLHHLKNPKLLLLKLYDIFNDDGKIIVRGSDDGGKLCHPRMDLLTEILDRYSKIVTTSDRSNGRKIYGQLYSTGFVNIKMLYSITDTCEKDRKNKENLFKVGFGFRLNTLDELIALNPNNSHLKSEREWLANALTTFKEVFCDRDFWYCNTSYIAIAGVR